MVIDVCFGQMNRYKTGDTFKDVTRQWFGFGCNRLSYTIACKEEEEERSRTSSLMATKRKQEKRVFVIVSRVNVIISLWNCFSALGDQFHRNRILRSILEPNNIEGDLLVKC